MPINGTSSLVFPRKRGEICTLANGDGPDIVAHFVYPATLLVLNTAVAMMLLLCGRTIA